MKKIYKMEETSEIERERERENKMQYLIEQLKQEPKKKQNTNITINDYFYSLNHQLTFFKVYLNKQKAKQREREKVKETYTSKF